MPTASPDDARRIQLKESFSSDITHGFNIFHIFPHLKPEIRFLPARVRSYIIVVLTGALQ